MYWVDLVMYCVKLVLTLLRDNIVLLLRWVDVNDGGNMELGILYMGGYFYCYYFKCFNVFCIR